MATHISVLQSHIPVDDLIFDEVLPYLSLGELGKCNLSPEETVQVIKAQILFSKKVTGKELLQLERAGIEGERLKPILKEVTLLEIVDDARPNTSGGDPWTLNGAKFDGVLANCPELITLRLNRCYGVDNEGLMRLAERCQKLAVLHIDNCYNISSEVLNPLLRALQNLRRISFLDQFIPYPELRRLFQGTHLGWLQLSSGYKEHMSAIACGIEREGHGTFEVRENCWTNMTTMMRQI